MLKVSVQYATGTKGIPTKTQFIQWVKTILSQNAEITIRIVSEKEGKELNQRYRGKNTATNVLAFFYDNTFLLLGDIVLCAAIIEKEAQQQNKALSAHYAHMTIHGILHLLGYDHKNHQEAIAMEQIETKILAELGYNDPYLDNC